MIYTEQDVLDVRYYLMCKNDPDGVEHNFIEGAGETNENYSEAEWEVSYQALKDQYTRGEQLSKEAYFLGSPKYQAGTFNKLSNFAWFKTSYDQLDSPAVEVDCGYVAMNQMYQWVGLLHKSNDLYKRLIEADKARAGAV